MSLELISSEELINELLDRYEQLIVIREDPKDGSKYDINVKTGFGDLSRDGVKFDLVVATEMLQSVQQQLVFDFLAVKA